MSERPFLLLSNDDGIFAKGLYALCRELSPYFDIAVVAPDRQRSGTGIGLTLHRAIAIEEVPLIEGVKAWKTSGKPADCVKLALSVLLKDRKPDMVISGINEGSNSGRNALYSGTVGAAMEAVHQGLPAIAFSSLHEENPDYAGVAPFAQRIILHFLNHSIPDGIVINVNFPSCETSQIKGIKYARQGLSYYMDNPYFDPKENGYYISKRFLNCNEHEESDSYYLAQNYITAVPIYVKELTGLAHFEAHKSTFNDSFLSI